MNPNNTPPRALTIAGSDPSGGAGLQADIALFTRLGVAPMAIPTALTVQNSLGVAASYPTPAHAVAEQLANLMADMPPAATKTGMLGNTDTITQLADQLDRQPLPNLVIDPVRLASSGAALLTEDGYASLRTRLLPHATLITPNRSEAEQLWGRPVNTAKDAAQCAQALLDLGPTAVMVTGGHLEDTRHIIDTLADADGVTTWRHPRHPGPSPHGTGCALSAAITAHLALGVPLRESIRHALNYVHNAILNATTPGAGRPYLGDGCIGGNNLEETS